MVRPTLSMSLRTYAPGSGGDWSRVLAWAVAADEVGVDRLVLSDHVVLGEHLDVHEQHGGAPFPTGSDGAWLEPMTVLSYLAGVTARARLATGVLIAPLRRPVVLAKAAATLDVLSGGRLDLGVGIGWQREEYEAAGLRFEERGRLLDEALAVCRALWAPGPAAYATKSLRFEGIWCEPKPVQEGGPAIWVSGTLAPRVADRIARFGSGWIPWAEYRHQVFWAMDRFRAEMDMRGRVASEFAVRHELPLVSTAGGEIDIDATIRDVIKLVDAGLTDFRTVVSPGADLERSAADLRRLVTAFRAVTGRAPV